MSSNPLEKDPARDDRIRERAYHLWQSEGQPHGRDAEYWERASELVGMEESAGAGQVSPAEEEARMVDGQIVEEASIQENLGEIPGRLTDQGEREQTPEPSKRGKAAAKPVEKPKPKESPKKKAAEPDKKEAKKSKKG